MGGETTWTSCCPGHPAPSKEGLYGEAGPNPQEEVLPGSRQLPLASLHELCKATASFPHPQVFRTRWNGHPSGAAEAQVLAPRESVDRSSCTSIPVPRFDDFYFHPN